MNLYFRVFDIESSPECKNDYFLVQTSKSQTDIHKYCHHLEEIEIRNRRRVQLTLHSNENGLEANSGIYATACISNLPGEGASNQAPCTCVPRSRRAARAARTNARSARSSQLEILPGKSVIITRVAPACIIMHEYNGCL